MLTIWKPERLSRLAKRLCRLRGVTGAAKLLENESGVSAVEFALVFPVLMTMGMYGVEVAYMMSVNMEISSLALSVADNASRLEQTNNSVVTPTVTENDIASVMIGVAKEGAGINLQTNGRVILSSLERDSTTGKQYIHWQRCTGSLTNTSAYGNQGTLNGLGSTTITGLGAGATKVTAAANSAVMYAEIFYRYNGLFGNLFVKPIIMKKEAAFIIRDIRNLGTAGTNPVSGTATYTC